MFGPEKRVVFDDGDYPEVVAAWNSKPVYTAELLGLKEDISVFRASTNTSHYLNHLIKAIQASSKHPVWAGKADDVIAILRGDSK